MRPALKTLVGAGLLLPGVLAGLVLITPAAALAQRPASPRYTFGAGAQGVGYYARPASQTATARSSAPGPKIRDRSTGQRMRNHKPWLRP